MGGAILIEVSDLHTNSTVGLCPPRVVLDDGGYYTASDAQKWLWACWLDFVEWAKDHIERHRPDRVIVVVNGDSSDGSHHRTFQIISHNPGDMIDMAYRVLEPLLDLADDVLVTRGTGAHVGGSGWMEEKIAKDINANTLGTDNHSHYKLSFELEGVYFDIRHHSSMGRRPWTRANSANFLASHIIMSRTEAGWRIPDVAVRAHMHRHADSGKNFKTVRALYSPAWQLATEYVHKVATEDADISDIGGLLFVCEDGSCEVFARLYQPAQPAIAKL